MSSSHRCVVVLFFICIAITLGAACKDPPGAGQLVLDIDRLAVAPGITQVNFTADKLLLFYGQAPAPPAHKEQSKCAIAKAATKPLIVEWPSAERLALEARARRGVVAVRYTGCEMEVLNRCQVPGSYSYSASTAQSDEELRDTSCP